jgi:hypothetical protein
MGTQGASQGAWLPPRAGHGCLASNRRLPALRHPFTGVSEAKEQNPGAKRAAGTKKRVLFDK